MKIPSEGGNSDTDKILYGRKLQIFFKKATMFAPRKLFLPSLLFVGKTRTLPFSGASESPALPADTTLS